MALATHANGVGPLAFRIIIKPLIGSTDNWIVQSRSAGVKRTGMGRGKPCQACRLKDRRIAQLERENQELRQQLAGAQQAQKRQAAPFSKGDPKRKPKRPGRKAGKRYGRHAFRPPPQHVDETIDVPVTACSCPDCGGELRDDTIHSQFQTDIPRAKPRATKFCIHRKRCKDCGRWVQGRHPEQTSDALGAASNQIGPNTISLGIQLNKATGASYGRISRFLEDFCGLTLSRSTILRAILRAAKKAAPLYEGIKSIVRHSPVVYPGESGWRVGGLKHWLWAFVSLKEKATLFMIEPSCGFDVIAVARCAFPGSSKCFSSVASSCETSGTKATGLAGSFSRALGSWSGASMS